MFFFIVSCLNCCYVYFFIFENGGFVNMFYGFVLWFFMCCWVGERIGVKLNDFMKYDGSYVLVVEEKINFLFLIFEICFIMLRNC